ncbi:Ankyrin-3 [Manis pentadactyla]|nr:Ankyrin-3 [Manis pentadactyla]
MGQLPYCQWHLDLAVLGAPLNTQPRGRVLRAARSGLRGTPRRGGAGARGGGAGGARGVCTHGQGHLGQDGVGVKPPKCEAPAGGRARNAEGALARAGGATRPPLTLPSARPGSLTAPPPRDSPGPAPAGSPPGNRKQGGTSPRGRILRSLTSAGGRVPAGSRGLGGALPPSRKRLRIAAV